jgi:hypothetical protein
VKTISEKLGSNFLRRSKALLAFSGAYAAAALEAELTIEEKPLAKPAPLAFLRI